MMGHQLVEQAALFYEFSLERHVPTNHMLGGPHNWRNFRYFRCRLRGLGLHKTRRSLATDRYINWPACLQYAASSDARGSARACRPKKSSRDRPEANGVSKA